jgi:hypothetical protein
MRLGYLGDFSDMAKRSVRHSPEALASYRAAQRKNIWALTGLPPFLLGSWLLQRYTLLGAAVALFGLAMILVIVWMNFAHQFRAWRRLEAETEEARHADRK